MNTKKWIVIALVVLALLSGGLNYYVTSVRNADRGGISTPRFGDGGEGKIVGSNRPVVLSFIGILATKGVKQADGTVVPFVADDILKLEAETLHALEYRWTYDCGTIKDEVIKDKSGQEWSKRVERDFDVQEGEYTFRLLLRGANPDEMSVVKETKVKVVPLFIEAFEKSIVHSGDRALPGDDFIVEVRMPKPLGGPIEPYRYRYFVRGDLVKVDGDEWTTEDTLFYKFPEPGNYDFKVQVRREDKKEAEAEAELAETITVAHAVLLEFDATPETQAAVGTQVRLASFPFSRFGKSEVRIGIKRITAAGFEWLTEQNGAVVWGNSDREWTPTLPGNYLIRAEIREIGKENADDAREFLFTVTEGGF